MISASRQLSFQLVFGANPERLFGWGNQDEDLLFARYAAPTEMANSKIRLSFTRRPIKEVREIGEGRLAPPISRKRERRKSSRKRPSRWQRTGNASGRMKSR